jgi:quercetin dioxygenase-like cupin family protein
LQDGSADGRTAGSIRDAAVVLACAELQPTLDLFVQRLGFRLERISPADDPRTALISGHGLWIELRRSSSELAKKSPSLTIPAGRPELVVSRAADATWVSGRAGMRYRDLIPGRFGGRFIASLIQIRDGGPVPDHVHFHDVRFQMIYCATGWVRVVYEDQGPPFILAAGDCVLQPPRIRHRVLESSAGLEVVEISCPAEHDTFIDHELGLPTDTLRPERGFDGQHFLHHIAGAAKSHTTRNGCRDLRLAEASGGLAGARVVHAESAGSSLRQWNHDGEILFVYLLGGSLAVRAKAAAMLSLRSGDSLAVPAGLDWELDSCSDDLEFLEVRLPAIER